MPVTPEPIEFSVDDAILNTWQEDTGDYLRLDSPPDAYPPAEPPVES